MERSPPPKKSPSSDTMAIINEARQFRDLIDNDPVLTGTVQAHNADGTSDVLMTGGGTVKVLGQLVPVNGLAFIQQGRVVGAAVNLPAYNLTV